MQLRRIASPAGATLALGLAVGLGSSRAAADSFVDGHVVYYDESGTGGPIRVISPAAQASVDLGDHVGVRAGWTADIVSGASIKIVDVTTSATEFSDTRHAFTGGLEFRRDVVTIGGSYTHGFESDYRSEAMALTARTELANRDSTFELGYAHDWDSVCNQSNAGVQDATRRVALDSSVGCFVGDPNRIESPLGIDDFSLTYSQNLSRVLVGQLAGSAQVLHGFQANPYRSVWLGGAIAQENHPLDRARFAVAGRLNLYLEPLHAALRLQVRGYRDTWDVRSVAAEVQYEQTVGPALRIAGRVRYYRQTDAAFYSDDYGTAPRGQYWTGDRDLSAMGSWIFGGRLMIHVAPNERSPHVAGIFSGIDLSMRADYYWFDYFNFSLSGTAVHDRRAIVFSGMLSLQF